MNPDEHHVALPKLYGAPAYARPPRVFENLERPLDPDDLPLEAFRADDGVTTGSAAVVPSPSGPAPGVWPSSGDVTITVDSALASSPSAPLPDMRLSDDRLPADRLSAEDAAPAADDGTSAADDAPSAAADVAPAAETTEVAEAPTDGPGLHPKPFSVRALARFLQGR